MMRRSAFFFLLIAFALTAACNRKPDAALCGSYYTHLLQLHQGGHKAVLAALKTSEGKRAVATYCMTLTKSQVECAVKSASIDAASSCEAETSKTFLPF